MITYYIMIEQNHENYQAQKPARPIANSVKRGRYGSKTAPIEITEVNFYSF
jgi:hypothetical protein